MLSGVATACVARLVVTHLDLGRAANPTVKTANSGPPNTAWPALVVQIENRPAQRLNTQVNAQDIAFLPPFDIAATSSLRVVDPRDGVWYFVK